MRYKKSNIDTISDYLSGTRPVIQVGYTPTDKKRKVGETWTDNKGIKWIQKENYRVRVNEQADLIRELTRKFCKTCKREINTFATRLDQKLYDMTGNCFDCQIEAETKMRINGTYKIYEQKKIFLNQMAYLEDIMKQIRDRFSKIVEDKVEFQNIIDEKNAKFVQKEKWSALDKTEQKKVLKNDYRMVFAEVLKLRKKLAELK